MAFTKLTSESTVIQNLPNKPTISAAELKEKFDHYGDTIHDFLNDSLIAELEGTGGAGNIGITQISNWDEDNVQDALEKLKDELDSAVYQAAVPDGSITTAKLDAKAVTTAKLYDKAVTSGKIDDGAVGATQLATDAVETAKIKDASVTADKLAGTSVTATKISEGAVETSKIADSAVTTAKINNGAVTAAKLDSIATRLRFTSVTVAASAWESDETYEDFPYRAAVTLTGATATQRPEVCFAPADAISGNFAPVADSYSGGIYLYAVNVPDDTITIPVIDLVR